MNDTMKLRGIFRLEVWHVDGRLLETYEDNNLVVNNGRTTVTQLLAGLTSGKTISKISFGTNGTAPAANNTAITNPYTKSLGASSFPTISSVRFDWTLESNEGNGKAIAEFGLLTGDNTLFARKTREVINKNSDIRLVGNWTITF